MNEEAKLSTEPYKGVRDFYPADWSVLSAIFAKEREVLTARGYEEYQASPLERTELYESKGNEEIIQEQTYTFEDRGGRSVTLRPEMTPSLARMIAGKRRELPFPQRWFSIGNRFRYERPQKGRLREFYQTDVDLIGLPEGEADLEAIGLASAIVKAFGAKDADFIIRVNSRALLNGACEAAGLKGETARQYLRLLDRKAKMPADEYARSVAALTPTDPLSLMEKGEGSLKDAKDSVLSIIQKLNERGVTNAVFDPLLARGFDYYTGVVFEVFDTNTANPRALFGGGRYDGLVSLFGGESLPGIGFAIGDVSFADFLETHGLLPKASSAPQLYVGTPSPEDLPAARELTEELAASGVRVFLNLTGKGLGDQVKDAVRRGIPYFVAFGANEAASGRLKLKDLAASQETEVARADIKERITG